MEQSTHKGVTTIDVTAAPKVTPGKPMVASAVSTAKQIPVRMPAGGPRHMRVSTVAAPRIGALTNGMMDFSQALVRMRGGRQISLNSWAAGTVAYLKTVGGVLVPYKKVAGAEEAWLPSVTEIMAEGYKVVS